MSLSLLLYTSNCQTRQFALCNMQKQPQSGNASHLSDERHQTI